MKKVKEITKPIKNGYDQMRKRKEIGIVYPLILFGYLMRWLFRGNLLLLLTKQITLGPAEIVGITTRILVTAFFAILLTTYFWKTLSALSTFWRLVAAASIGFCIPELAAVLKSILGGIDISTLL